MAARARAVSPHQLNDKLALEQMRTNLLGDIEKYQKRATSFLTSSAMAAAFSLRPDMSALGVEWDAMDDIPESAGVERDSSSGTGSYASASMVPERFSIALPSNLGVAFCRAHDLMGLVEKERRLRVGQMNDALHSVRVAIGYKSFLYRHGVRQATSQRQKLRSFDDVHLADEGVLSWARIYTAARTALLNLYDRTHPEDLIALQAVEKRYQPLEKRDLRANTALIEQSTRGVRHLHLAWFWSMDVQGDSQNSGWMNESKQFSALT